jgi:hypothetical protein
VATRLDHSVEAPCRSEVDRKRVGPVMRRMVQMSTLDIAALQTACVQE